MFDWLLCFTVKTAHDKLETNLKVCQEPFEARNKSQVYCAKTLSIIFMEVPYSTALLLQILSKLLHYRF